MKFVRCYVVPIFGLLALAAFFYFLLPVSISSQLSADHVRWVYSASDISPVVSASLSSVWSLLLNLMRATGLGVDRETFATAAALSAWISLCAFLVLSRYVSWSAILFVALSPAVLWTSVVPNGMSLGLLVLALIGYLCSPDVTFDKHRARWTFGAVFEGLGCALTPFAWPLAMARAYRVRNISQPKSTRLIRVLLFAAGFSAPMAIAVLLEAARGTITASFALLPVYSSLRLLLNEDVLGAGRAMGLSGEISIGYFASFMFMTAAFCGSGWLTSRRWRSVAMTILGLAYLFSFVVGDPRAWKIAHPGWNTIIEDFAMNLERSLSKTTVAIVQTPTEEAATRYVSAILVKPSHVVAVRTSNLFDSVTIARVQAHEPRFQLNEAVAKLKSISESGEAKGDGEHSPGKLFSETLILPNVERGVQFWIDTSLDQSNGLEIQFLPIGLKVTSFVGPTKFITDRNALRNAFVRARPTLREYLAGPSLETKIFSRYAVFHLASARILEREKRTSDWSRRARGEYYAALRKVEWLKDAYTKVCVEPELEDQKHPSPETSQATKPEPLDVCVETAWYYKK